MKEIIDQRFLRIIHDFQEKHGCHTIILYGSRARGDSTNTSDYDIIGIREKNEFSRDCRMFEDGYLDAFIYSENDIKNQNISLLRIKDGVVLCQKDHQGDDLIDKIKVLFQKGPPKTLLWEKHEMVSWMGKMLNRSEQNDIEGNFRRHWLLHDMLECYFKLRDQWYLGPKESFQWLKINDYRTYAGFDKALEPNASVDEIQKLIDHITQGYLS